MLKFNGGRGAIICNKCRIVVKDDLSMMTKEVWEKNLVKRHYCGYCIQERIDNYCRKEEKQ